jgi:signal transduction histidine kinase
MADAGPRRDAARVDAQSILGALDSAVAVVGADWRILLVSEAWERVFGRAAADCVRRDVFACFPFLADAHAVELMRAARTDRATRHFELEHLEVSGGGADAGRFTARVASTPEGLLVVEVSRQQMRASEAETFEEHNEENVSLRKLARQMAAVADSTELLELLCAAAATQCGATGAAVLRANGGEGEVVSAAGEMTIAVGRRFALEGSVARDVLQSRGIVAVEAFTAQLRPLARTLPELRIGPMVAAPLIAHDVVLGVLAVVRGERAIAFSPHDAQRLRVIADHAALAMWKAQLLEQSQAADRAKGRFLATISHELRTPLTALTGYEELLADEVIGPLTEPQIDVLERMRSVTHHLTVMIEEVLAYSSIEAGREVVRPSEFLAADLVRAAVAIVEPIARQKKLRLAYDLPTEPIRVTSDIDKVRQIIVNLAGNAVKFTERGDVRIGVHRAAGSDAASSGGRGAVCFSVHDTGAGIAADDLRRLFRPFAQVDAGLTRRHGGTGLGLYISQRLAQLLGGRIDVESEPGSGSTFTLTIPVE